MYGIGVDLGTTYTAAATIGTTSPSMLGLGNRALQIPSVLYIQTDGSILVGETAERRGAADPTKVVREFKRRIGDSVPILVAGRPYSPQVLTARLLRWVIDVATERMGTPPAWVTLTHPANWRQFKLDVLEQAAIIADIPHAILCPEPVAAAMKYASDNRVGDGERICVYDLGGGTFDVCVLVKGHDGFRTIGVPEGIEHLGGIDFDEALFRWVIDAAGLADNEAMAMDLAGLSRLRRDCVDAKEALSMDVETVVPVSIGGTFKSVRITRSEFESWIQPALTETIAATHRAIRSADLSPSDISTFVLVGGSSRMPLITEMLTGELRRPVARDTHPKHDVALGAAIIGARQIALRPPQPHSAPAAPSHTAPDLDARQGIQPPFDPGATVPAAPPPGWSAPIPGPQNGPDQADPDWQPATSNQGAGGWRSRKRIIASSAAVAVLIVSVGIFAMLRFGGSSGDANSSTSTTSSEPSTPTSSSVSQVALPASADPLPDSVVISPRVINKTMDLYGVDSETGKTTQYTDTKGQAEGPTISPDRRTIVYMAVTPDGTAALRVVGADGTADRPLFERAPAGCDRVMYRPAWNPVEPDQIAMNCANAQGEFSLRIIRLDGSVVRTLDVGQEIFDDLTFSPDGMTLAFWAGPKTGGGSGSIFTMPADGSAPATKITDGGAGTDADPVFSPDGTQIVFRRILDDGTVPKNTELFLVKPDGSDLRPLASHAGDDQDPTWSPDGKQIAFNSTRGEGDVNAGINHVLIMDADGQNLRRLAPTNPYPEQSAPGWGHR